MSQPAKFAAILTSLLLLAGCSAGASAPAAGDAAGGRVEPELGSVPMPAGEPTEGGQFGTDPQIARTAMVELKVDDVEKAAGQLRALASSAGGQVLSENLIAAVADTSPSGSSLVLSVDSTKLDGTLDQLKSIGTIVSRVVTAEDVTTQVADVNARLKTLEASIDRLRELSERAGSIKELTELESELTSRIAERDSLVAQQKILAGRVAQSPITITLITAPPAGELETTGFFGGLAAGWNALVATARMLLTVLGAVLPFVVVIGVVVVPVLLWRQRRNRPRPTSTETSAAEGED